MKRKGWIRLLSTVVALMLPLSAMAQSAAIDLLDKAKTDKKEIVSTITFVPGATLSADKIVADLSAATAIRINKIPGGYGAFSLVLNGVDTVAAQMRAETDGLYVQSETLGDKPLYFSWDDLNKFITETMKSSGANQASIDQFSNGFMSGMQQYMQAGMMGAVNGTETPKLSEEEIKQKITEAMGGDEAFVKWMSAIEAKKVVTTGEFTVEGSDTADTKTELTVTKEDMASLYDVPYIQKQITTQLKASDSTLTDEQAAAKTKETVDQIKAAVLKSDMTMPITVYIKGEDDLVGLELSMTGTFTNDSDVAVAVTAEPSAEPTATATEAVPVKMDVHMVYSRKTNDTGKLYTLKMNAAQNDKPLFDLNGSLNYTDKNAAGTLTLAVEEKPVLEMALAADYSDAKHTAGQLNVTLIDTGKTIAFVVGLDQVTGDTTIDTALSVSSGDSIDAIKAAGDAALLGTLKINTVVQDNSGFFSALSEASPATSLEVLKLSAEEQKTYLTTLQTNAFQTLYKVLGNLPESVASELAGAMNTK